MELDLNITGRDVKAADQRTVLHEFGHALGLDHEHQRACCPLEVGVANMRTYLPNIEWSCVQKNFMQLPETRMGPFSYDMKSIMHYTFPGWMTKQLIGVAMNFEPSVKDIAFITYLYPKPTGGTFNTGFYGSRNCTHIEFLSFQKSAPCIFPGINAMRWNQK
jgi:hypothetical protein